MSTTGRTDFETATLQALDRFQNAGRVLDFWWRDDDAIKPTPELDRLIDAATSHDTPLLLATIPESAIPALFDRIRNVEQITISQHGFAHINHETKPAKAAELGAARSEETVLSELLAGKLKLQHYGGDQFAAILTPPWNRISEDIAKRRLEIGLPGLSTFGPATGDRFQVNTQLDVIAWRGSRGFIGWEKAKRIVEEEIARRLAGDEEPFGLLTHHLVHDEDVWEFLDCFLGLLDRHDAVHKPALGDLFSLNIAS